MSSVCPRLTTHKTTSIIDAVNADLVHLCDEKSVTFIDNTPLFTLSDGSVNDGYLQRDGVHITTTAINRVAKNLALKIICAEDGACGQARPPPPPTTRRSDIREIINHKNDDDIARRPQPRRPNRVAKNQAQKIICTEDGACGQARPPPPPTTRRSDRRDIGNHKTAMTLCDDLNRDDHGTQITTRMAGRPCAANLRDMARPTVTSAAKAAMSRTTAVMGTNSSATPAVSLAIRRSFVPIIRGTAKKTIRMPPELKYSTL